jgi:hypothetical protein
MVCLRNMSVDTLHKGDTEDNNNIKLLFIKLLLLLLLCIPPDLNFLDPYFIFMLSLFHIYVHA